MLEPLQAIGSILGYLSGAVAGGFLLNDVVQAAMKNHVEYAMLVLYNILCLIFFVLFSCLCCFYNSR